MGTAILYQIVNIVTGLRYVGVTIQNLNSRFSQHLYRMRKGLHNDKMLSAYKTHGKKSFLISEIERGTPEDMFKKEKILTLETVKSGYNAIIGGNDLEERAASSKVYWDKLELDPIRREAYIKKIAKANLGKKLSDEVKRKISVKRTGSKWELANVEKRKKQYSGSGNPNFENFKLYLNELTGIYYTTPEFLFFLGTNKSGLQVLRRNKSNRLNNFIKC